MFHICSLRFAAIRCGLVRFFVVCSVLSACPFVQGAVTRLLFTGFVDQSCSRALGWFSYGWDDGCKISAILASSYTAFPLAKQVHHPGLIVSRWAWSANWELWNSCREHYLSSYKSSYGHPGIILVSHGRFLLGPTMRKWWPLAPLHPVLRRPSRAPLSILDPPPGKFGRGNRLILNLPGN